MPPRLVPALSWVAVSVVLSGVLTYGYLALVARALPADEYGWFGAYWSLALVLGFGVFLPLELEVARLVHRRGGGGLPPGAWAACAVLTAVSLVAVLGAGPLLLPALGGHGGLVLALAAVCVVSGGQFLLRGLLLGRGAYGRHGVVLVADAALRVLTAAAVAVVAGPADAAVFGWTLVAALALAHLPLLAWIGGARSPAPTRPAERLRLPAVAHLVTGTLCAQALLNAAPVVVAAAAGPGELGVAAAFAAAFTLVRLPLFVAVPLQGALLPALTDVTAREDATGRRRLLTRLLGAVAVLATAAGVAGGLAGPAAVALVFGNRYVIDGGTVAVLAVGSVLHLGLLVCGQAVVAAGRHRAGALAWMVGLAVTAATAAAVPGTAARGSWAFTLGSAAALACCTLVLLRVRPAGAPAEPAPARTPGAAP